MLPRVSLPNLLFVVLTSFIIAMMIRAFNAPPWAAVAAAVLNGVVSARLGWRIVSERTPQER